MAISLEWWRIDRKSLELALHFHLRLQAIWPLNLQTLTRSKMTFSSLSSDFNYHLNWKWWPPSHFDLNEEELSLGPTLKLLPTRLPPITKGLSFKPHIWSFKKDEKFKRRRTFIWWSSLLPIPTKERAVKVWYDWTKEIASTAPICGFSTFVKTRQRQEINAMEKRTTGFELRWSKALLLRNETDHLHSGLALFMECTVQAMGGFFNQHQVFGSSQHEITRKKQQMMRRLAK